MSTSSTEATEHPLVTSKRFKTLFTRFELLGFLLAVVTVLLGIAPYGTIAIHSDEGYTVKQYADYLEDGYIRDAQDIAPFSLQGILSFSVIGFFLLVAVVFLIYVIVSNTLLNKTAHESLIDSRSVVLARINSVITSTLGTLLSAMAWLALILFIWGMISVSIVEAALIPAFVVAALKFAVLSLAVLVLAGVAASHLGTSTLVHEELSSVEEVTIHKPVDYAERIALKYPQSLVENHSQVGISASTTLKVYTVSYFPYVAGLTLLGVIAGFVGQAWVDFSYLLFYLLAVAISSAIIFGYYTLVFQNKHSTLRIVLATLTVIFCLFLLFTVFAVIANFASGWTDFPLFFTQTIIGLVFLYLAFQLGYSQWFAKTSNKKLPPAVFFPKNYAISFLPVLAHPHQALSSPGSPEQDTGEDPMTNYPPAQ